jgi:hypothetical protein
MIDITSIELNKLPPPIAELETANSVLRTRNTLLRNILIIGGAVVAIFIADKVIKYIKEENERKGKGEFPTIN